MTGVAGLEGMVIGSSPIGNKGHKQLAWAHMCYRGPQHQTALQCHGARLGLVAAQAPPRLRGHAFRAPTACCLRGLHVADPRAGGE